MPSFSRGMIARTAMSGAGVALSGATVVSDAPIGTTIGVLSVVGGTGTYTYALTDPSGLFVIAGSNLNVKAALSPGTYPITVTATGGTPSPLSNVFAITVTPAAVAPANTALPVISGSTVVGQTLTTTNGSWSGSPTGYTYQWQRGVPDTLPVNTVLPAITGTASVGSTLTATDGTWTGSPAPTYVRQWKRNGTNISGATASTYLLVSADLGATITCTVTATNAAGSVNATSAGVGPITAVAIATLDPAFIAGASSTLDATKLIFTSTAGGGYVSARSTTSYSTGKKSFRVKCTNFVSVSMQIGVCNAAQLNGYPQGIYDGHGFGQAADGQWWGNSGANIIAASPGQAFTNPVPTDWFVFEIDFDTKQVWIADPTSGRSAAMSWAAVTESGPWFACFTLTGSPGLQIQVDFTTPGTAGFGNW